MTAHDLRGMSYKEVQQEAKKHGVLANGTKEDIIQRMKNQGFVVEAEVIRDNPETVGEPEQATAEEINSEPEGEGTGQYAMPEGMVIEPPKESKPVIEVLDPPLTPEEEITNWLMEVAEIRIPQRKTGVHLEGSEDAVALAKKKEIAKKIIQLNITKLYATKVKKVAIVGTAMSWQFAPFGDPSWEIWGLNDHWNILPRATRWYESQNEEHCSKTPTSHTPAQVRMDWYKKSPIPVYMPDHYDSAPMSVEYPVEAIQTWLGEVDPEGINYFTSTVSFMMALALYEGFDKIHLFGVDLAVGSEYEKQRPSCEFFCGIAKGLGVELYIPGQSDILKCIDRYGMKKEGHVKRDALMQKLQDRRAYQKSQIEGINRETAQMQDNLQRLAASKFQYEGAMSDVEQTLKVWGMI